MKVSQKPVEYTEGLFKEVEATVGTNVRILVGNELKFICPTKKGANVNRTWLIDDNPLPKSNDYMVDEDDVCIIFLIGLAIFNIFYKFNDNSKFSHITISPRQARRIKHARFTK